MNFYELNESAANRYSVEVNFRTTLDEIIDNWVKLTLGYVSAALKQNDLSIKKVFTEKPYRIIISGSKNGGYFQNGEWVAVVTYNTKQDCFYISKGFYKKDTKNVNMIEHKKSESKSASDLYKDIRNFMHSIKDEPPHVSSLNPVKKQTGPTQGSMRPGQGLINKGRSDGPAFKMGA